MTVGTLLLGFVVTGTLLGIVFTGQDAYAGGELVVFVRWSGICILSSAAALILAFFASVRGLHAYATGSAQHGFALLFRNTILMVLSELSVYVSIFAFIWTFLFVCDRSPRTV